MNYKVEVTSSREALKNMSEECECETTIIEGQSEETYCFLFPLIEILNEMRLTEIKQD